MSGSRIAPICVVLQMSKLAFIFPSTFTPDEAAPPKLGGGDVGGLELAPELGLALPPWCAPSIPGLRVVWK